LASSAAESVAIVYFDSSAFVKLVVEEQGSDLAAELWDGCDAAVSSRLSYPEVHAALAAAARNRQLTSGDRRLAASMWEKYWQSTWPIEITEEIEQHAGQLAGALALRGADAVHLSSALELRTPDLVVAVWDRRLHAGAVASDLRVAPARLGE
jgi:predicted nucleic acid-binding protein